jgi:hypothetical protein
MVKTMSKTEQEFQVWLASAQDLARMHECASVVEVVARRIASAIAEGEARLKMIRDATAKALIERDAARAQRDAARQEHTQVRASIESMNRSKEAFRKQLDAASGTPKAGRAA